MDYFQALMSLVGQNTEAFISIIGIEFILNFTLQHHHNVSSEASHTVSGKIQTSLKKLLHLQKTRDAVIPINGAADPADQ
jgi:hypothetical protein